MGAWRADLEVYDFGFFGLEFFCDGIFFFGFTEDFLGCGRLAFGARFCLCGCGVASWV